MEGALEVPILEETLAARFSFTLSDRDGWGENGCANLPSLASRVMDPVPLDRVAFCGEETNLALPNPNPPPNFLQLSRVPGGLPKNVNDVGTWAARSIFRFRPESNDSDWLLILRGGRTDQQSTLGQTVGTNRQYGVGTTSSGYRDADIPPMFEERIQKCQDVLQS